MTSYPLDSATITFKIGENEYVFDLLEMEIMMEEEVDNKKPTEWVPVFQEWFKAHSNVELSYSQAVNCADLVRRAYIEFKKKYDEGLKSVFPSDETPSPSPNENMSS